MHTFSSIRDHSIAKRLKCSHSATKTPTSKGLGFRASKRLGLELGSLTELRPQGASTQYAYPALDLLSCVGRPAPLVNSIQGFIVGQGKPTNMGVRF